MCQLMLFKHSNHIYKYVLLAVSSYSYIFSEFLLESLRHLNTIGEWQARDWLAFFQVSELKFNLVEEKDTCI